MANEGMLMLAGLGALLLLGSRKGKQTDQETITGTVSGFPGMSGAASEAFDIAGFVQSLFAQTATVVKQPEIKLVVPEPVIVTGSGVPAVTQGSTGIITSTTKVQIGGDGGETITASALAVKRTEQVAQQQLEVAANVQPKTWAATAEINRIEEARQRDFAAKLISEARNAQRLRNEQVEARTRIQQENINKGLNPDGSPRSLPAGMSVIGAPKDAGPPTINWDQDDDDWSYSFGDAGQDITVTGGGPDMVDVDFTPEYSESFVISGGMDSPAFASEDEQPPGPVDYGYGAYYGGAEDE